MFLHQKSMSSWLWKTQIVGAVEQYPANFLFSHSIETLLTNSLQEICLACLCPTVPPSKMFRR